jgi:hypothetical protein
MLELLVDLMGLLMVELRWNGWLGLEYLAMEVLTVEFWMNTRLPHSDDESHLASIARTATWVVPFAWNKVLRESSVHRWANHITYKYSFCSHIHNTRKWWLNAQVLVSMMLATTNDHSIEGIVDVH